MDDEAKTSHIRHITQAERVIDLFTGVNFDGRQFRSGAAALAHAIQLVGGPYKRAAIYKWLWPVERSGRGGIIPTQAVPWVERAARAAGVFLSPGIMDPRGQTIKIRRASPGTANPDHAETSENSEQSDGT